MHRSGTSLIGEVLHRWGAFGRIDECLPANEWNARGYWELSTLVAFNEQLLRKVSSDWTLPPGEKQREQLRSLAGVCTYRDEALRLLSLMNIDEQQIWFWKDPRLSLLLPFWQQIWGEVRYVICVRDPLEICQSLNRRDGLSSPVSLALWQSYMVSVLNSTRHLPRLVVSYSRMLQAPAEECSRLAKFLGESDAATANIPAMGRAVDGTLKRCSVRGAAPRLNRRQQELYALLLKMAEFDEESVSAELGECKLPATWRESLQANLLLLRCWKRWNRIFGDVAPQLDGEVAMISGALTNCPRGPAAGAFEFD